MEQNLWCCYLLLESQISVSIPCSVLFCFFSPFFVASYSFKELGHCMTALLLGCMLALSIS